MTITRETNLFDKLSPETQELLTSHITTVQYVLVKHEQLCKEARDLVEIKGSDYNRQEQGQNSTGDTLANMRLAKYIGLADSNCQSVMIRLMDKMMRLKSLTKNPEQNPAVKDESVRQTIIDSINYLVYLSIFYDEEK